jgi:hypothetical protein
MFYNAVFFFSFFMLLSCNPLQSERIVLGRNNAEHELKIALSDPTSHNIVNSDSILIKDKDLAIDVVEPILFRKYGRKDIVEQKPYESYLIDKYWVISGTLPKGSSGGTFLVILDSRNSRIIRLTHGK